MVRGHDGDHDLCVLTGWASPVAMRFPEGVTHAFLLVRSFDGKIIGQGEMTQVAKAGNIVESHLIQVPERLSA